MNTIQLRLCYVVLREKLDRELKNNIKIPVLIIPERQSRLRPLHKHRQQ
jgi:hypothetical protein